MLRENKFGVTVIEGYGIEGPREILNVAFNRKDLEKLRRLVYEYDEKAFITVNNINPVSGGFFLFGEKEIDINHSIINPLI